jgi:hypothetical protein
MSERLRQFAAELDIDLTLPRRSLQQSTAEAIDLSLLDIALTELITLLSPHQRDVLMQVATSNLPIAADGAAAMLAKNDDEVPADQVAVSAALRGLVARSLVTPIGDPAFFVQRWTAQGLKRHDDPDRWRERSICAARYRDQLRASGRVEDAMEATRNLVEAEQYEPAAARAASIAHWMARSGHSVALAAFAGEVLASIPLDS